MRSPATIGVVAFFASILGHELAHAVVARRFGVATTSIDLWALGGVARLDREPQHGQGPRAGSPPPARSPASPSASSRYGAALVGVRLDAPDTVVTVLGWLGIVNVALGVFNLLPGAPLDGGRIVRAVRWARHGNRYRAMREAGHAGRVIGWALAGFGLALMLNDRPGLLARSSPACSSPSTPRPRSPSPTSASASAGSPSAS